MQYGILLLGIVLIITRGLPLIGIDLLPSLAYRVLEIVAGVVLLAQEGSPRGRMGYGWTLVGVYMILVGAFWLVGATTGWADIVKGLTAAVAAILLMTSGRNLYRQWTGTLLLTLWLADMALVDLIHLSFQYHAKLGAALAVAAGAFLIARR